MGTQRAANILAGIRAMRRSQSLTHFELSLRDGAIAVAREMRRHFRRAETSASLRPTIYGRDAPRLIERYRSLR